MKRNILCRPWYDRFVMYSRFNIFGVGVGEKGRKVVRDKEEGRVSKEC